MRRNSLVGLAVLLAGCGAEPQADARFAVGETRLDHRGSTLPLIRVQAVSGPALTRDDWTDAEDAARAYCAASDAVFRLRPPSRHITQIIFDDGVFDFVAACDAPR